MKKAIFEYSDRMVCNHCGTNDQIHYNLFVRHGETWVESDPNGEIWCNNCDCEVAMVDPECYEPSE